MQERVFFGAAIQGAIDRAERAPVNKSVIDLIRRSGLDVVSEHTIGLNKEETMMLLEKGLGTLPHDHSERSRHIRKAMLDLIDGDIVLAVFEVSVPSLGTGIEFDRACTRPDRGLSPIPIVALYQKDYWPHGLSTMISGVNPGEFPSYSLIEYESISDLESQLGAFLSNLNQKRRA